MSSRTSHPLLDVFWQFLILGVTSFGGPVAHLGYFRQRLIEQRKWMKDEEYAQLVAICQFLPGPASSQVGFALGIYRAGWLGGLFAFLCFTLPSVLFLILFAEAIPHMPDAVQVGLIKALKLVAVIVVFQAVCGMWQNICVDIRAKAIALVACGILLFSQFGAMHLLVLAAAAVAGMSVLKAPEQQIQGLRFNIPTSVGIACLSLFVGLLVISILLVSSTGTPTLSDVFFRFYETGALIFGGGHVVLPMLQQTVVAPGWLSEESFIVGYGAAQAVPGPLFTLASFLGYEITSEHLPLLVAMIATVAIFLPGFLLLIGVLPFWQKLHQYPVIANAVVGLNAGVVGLLAATFVNPILIMGIQSTSDIVFIAAGCLCAVWFKLPIAKILLLCFAYSALMSL